MKTHRIVALDLSLVETGYAIALHDKIESFGILRGTGTGVERMIDMKNKVMMTVRDPDKAKTLVVIEDIPPRTNMPYAKENAGLNYAIRMELFYPIPYVMVSTMGLKKFATGKGSPEVTKEQVSDALKRSPFAYPNCSWALVENGNITDAIALVFMGMALVEQWQPTTKAQQEALATVRRSNKAVFSS